MSDIFNSHDFEDVQDQSTSFEDLPSASDINSTASTSTTIINIITRNDRNNIQLNYKPSKNKNSKSTQPKCSAKSPKVMKHGKRIHKLHLDLSEQVFSNGNERAPPPSRCTNITEPFIHMSKLCRKPRCTTNSQKAMKSVEKNHFGTRKEDLEPSINNILQMSKWVQGYLKYSSREANSQNLISKIYNHNITTAVVGGQTFVDNKKLKISKCAPPHTLKISIPKSITFRHLSVPRSNTSSLYWGDDWIGGKNFKKINATAVLNLSNRRSILNVQDEFKWKVRKPTNKIDYLCRTCKFVQLEDLEIKQPLLILDLDAFLVTFPLSYDTLSHHQSDIYKLPCNSLSNFKQGFSDFINSMDPFFNIAIWSAVKMNVLISRLDYLDILNAGKIIFCLDYTSTIKRFIPSLGNTIMKPLEIIWRLYPKYNKKNTIMVNEELKKLIYEQFGMPIGSQIDKTQKITRYELIMVADFLTNIASTGKPFSNLNVPSWKKPWN